MLLGVGIMHPVATRGGRCTAAPQSAVDASSGFKAEAFLRPHLLKLAPYTPIEPFEVRCCRCSICAFNSTLLFECVLAAAAWNTVKPSQRVHRSNLHDDMHMGLFICTALRVPAAQPPSSHMRQKCLQKGGGKPRT